VSRYYGIDDANALLPELASVIDRLRGQRDELVGLRDAYRDREVEAHRGPGDSPVGEAPEPDADPGQDDPELRRLRLRMRGIVDQMAADVTFLDQRSIVLRDIATGLLDFPALVGGREVWLCWRSGEPGIGFWHGQDEGFAGRRPLAQLPDAARA
jgi:hypothetical protein